MYPAAAQAEEPSPALGETRVIIEVVRCCKVAERAVGARQVYVAERRRQQLHIPAGGGAILALPSLSGSGRGCQKLAAVLEPQQ